MKNVLIVHAHPEKNSFCSALKDKAKDFFAQKGAHVELTDLYQDQFNPIGGKNDFYSLKDEEYFKYQIEQVHAVENNLFKDDIKKEMDKLIACDTLIFNFPLWWFSMPAILKGWVDRVFAMGLVYGNGIGVYENGRFREKKAFICVTTGGPEMAYQGGKNGDLNTILFPINHGILYFAGMQVLPSFISYSPVRKTNEERELELQKYQHFLENLDSEKVLF